MYVCVCERKRGEKKGCIGKELAINSLTTQQQKKEGEYIKFKAYTNDAKSTLGPLSFQFVFMTSERELEREGMLPLGWCHQSSF